MGVELTEIPTQEIKDPVGKQVDKVLLQQRQLVGQLAHPLLQFNAIPQHLSSRLETPVLLLLAGRIATGQSAQQGQIRLPATAEGRCLRRLQALASQMEGLLCSTGLPEQHQAGHLVAGRHIQPHRFIGMGCTEGQKRCLVISTGHWIGQQIGRPSQQGQALKQSLMGEAVIRRTVTSALKLAQDCCWIGGWTDTKQSEMIDGQIHRQEVPMSCEL